VPPHDDLPLDDVLVRAREHARGFKVWLEHLRAQDPPFAQASVVNPDDMGEWQAAVYLLTTSSEVGNAMGDDVLANTSIAPIIDELAQPHRAWSSSEDGVMQWAAHFWDVGRWPARFPYVFAEFYFRRWISACRLHKRIPPALTTVGGER
jgi:hypothetical protein